MENDVYYMAYRALDSLNRTLIIIGAVNSDVEAGEPTLFDDPFAIEERRPAMYASASGTSQAIPHVTGAAALLMSAFPDATPAQIKAALLDGANKDKNPHVYPYAGYVKRYVERDTQEIDAWIETGRIPLVSRDELIAKITLVYEEMYAPYEQFDGVGRVSRTGLLDVKAAYDLLEERLKPTLSSSSSGCSAGYSVMMVLAVILAASAIHEKR